MSPHLNRHEPGPDLLLLNFLLPAGYDMNPIFSDEFVVLITAASQLARAGERAGEDEHKERGQRLNNVQCATNRLLDWTASRDRNGKTLRR